MLNRLRKTLKWGRKRALILALVGASLLAMCQNLARFCTTAYHLGYIHGPSACEAITRGSAPKTLMDARLRDLATSACLLGAADALAGHPPREAWIWETTLRTCLRGREM